MARKRPYGVLGRVLGHSYTPVIYKELAGLDYRRFEREPEELEEFVTSEYWEGFNITIPYKRSLLPYMTEISPLAQRMGNINTVTRLADGGLRGDNTDYYGFKCLVESLGVELEGKRALVFGASGGAGTTACMVLGDMGMKVIPVGRKEEVNYNNLVPAELAVNCTPVGMYPKCPESPCKLADIEGLEAFVDIVYNPCRTDLIMQAEELGIPCVSGLLMLVAQAAQAVELYTGQHISIERIHEVTDALSDREQNIALIGMPGSGKTRVGENLGARLGRELVDLDHAFYARHGIGAGDYITTYGEDAFRAKETELLAEYACKSGLIISTGGGVVTRPENYPLLHQNSKIIMLNRKLDELSKKGRPISARDGIEKLAEQRMPIYKAWADIVIDSKDSARHTAEALLPQLS